MAVLDNISTPTPQFLQVRILKGLRAVFLEVGGNKGLGARSNRGGKMETPVVMHGEGVGLREAGTGIVHTRPVSVAKKGSL